MRELFFNFTRVTKIIRYYRTVFVVVSTDTVDCKGRSRKEGKDFFLTLNSEKLYSNFLILLNRIFVRKSYTK